MRSALQTPVNPQPEAFKGPEVPLHFSDRNQFEHQVVDHAVQYVDGKIHTNGLENFWSLLKRGLNGTYISVEPFHLFRYLDEQTFRYNNRKEMDDFDRFRLAMSQIVGKRLTWDRLTGKEPEAQTCLN
jgi:hypothetical protein